MQYLILMLTTWRRLLTFGSPQNGEANQTSNAQLSHYLQDLCGLFNRCHNCYGMSSHMYVVHCILLYTSIDFICNNVEFRFPSLQELSCETLGRK